MLLVQNDVPRVTKVENILSLKGGGRDSHFLPISFFDSLVKIWAGQGGHVPSYYS